jgi:hypothetical protein
MRAKERAKFMSRTTDGYELDDGQDEEGQAESEAERASDSASMGKALGSMIAPDEKKKKK